MIPKRKFSDLLRIIGKVPGLERLRFVTSHPRYMSLGVVDAVAETDAACESFHIPFQSGSNEILASMGRGHTREKYLHIIDRIRSVSYVVNCTDGQKRKVKKSKIYIYISKKCLVNLPSQMEHFQVSDFIRFVHDISTDVFVFLLPLPWVGSCCFVAL